MTRSEQLAPEMHSAPGILDALRRLRPVLIAVLAIGLATGAAFVALVWLDGSMRFLTPSVIRLGAGMPRPAPLPVASAEAAG